MRDIAPSSLDTIREDVENVAGTVPAGGSRGLVYETRLGGRTIVVRVTVTAR